MEQGTDESAVRSKSFKEALNRAKKAVTDNEQVNKILQNTKAKLEELDEYNGIAKPFFEKVKTFIRMLRAYSDGTYRELPWKSILLITGGLIYFITPLDFIPDFIPVFGMLDDVSVIMWIFKSISSDIEDFEAFEQHARQTGQ